MLISGKKRGILEGGNMSLFIKLRNFFTGRWYRLHIIHRHEHFVFGDDVPITKKEAERRVFWSRGDIDAKMENVYTGNITVLHYSKKSRAQFEKNVIDALRMWANSSFF